MPIIGTAFGETFTTLLALIEQTRHKTCGVEAAGSIARPEMRNDRNLVVVWATLIGLVAIAFWFKVPLV